VHKLVIRYKQSRGGLYCTYHKRVVCLLVMIGRKVDRKVYQSPTAPRPRDRDLENWRVAAKRSNQGGLDHLIQGNS